MHSFLGAIRAVDAYIMLGLFGLWLILLIYSFSLSGRLKRLARRQSARVGEGSVGEITDWLNEHSGELSALRSSLDGLTAEHNEKVASLGACVQKIGMVRFNAFEDIGGEQSFALVLLDGRNNGVVISSLYGRQDARLYAKGIVNGEGERALSDEEQQALNSALTGKRVAEPDRATAGR